jgi:hypothetical protein
VRGGQGKHRDRFQAYETVESKKRTVPGLFGSPHDAAVALAQWKQQRELGLADEPAAKRPRKRRSPKAAEHAAGELVVASFSQPSRLPMQLIQPATALALPPATPTIATAVLLPRHVPAAAYGVPVALGLLS